MSRKEVRVNVDTGVIVSIVNDGESTFLCVLDDEGNAFYRFKLNEANMLRLVGECAHQVLTARDIWYWHKTTEKPDASKP